MKRLLLIVLLVFVLAVVAAAGGGVYLWRRALPQIDGTVRVQGLTAPVEVVRDPSGIPHIFARNDGDAYFGLGYVVAQDRLFQMHLLRRLGQGRLAEVFGAAVLDVDKLFRTVDMQGPGVRMFREATPPARAAIEAYTAGANAYLERLGGNLPVEFTVLGVEVEPFQAEDFAGLLGYMTWGLNPAWQHDPLFERLRTLLPPERLAEAYPYSRGGSPSIMAANGVGDRPAEGAAEASIAADPVAADPVAGARPHTGLPILSAAQDQLLDLLVGLRASNNWAVSSQHSTTGAPILANDPHLGHGLPGIWYQAHLSTPDMDVIGVTIAGMPFISIGHNQDIAWGFTNVMADAADFFRERINPDDAGQVMYRGQWAPITERTETIHVKGGDDVPFTVRSTPHGPLVTDLLKGQEEPVSYRWVLHAATDANEYDGFHALNRARNWDEFRQALSHFGALAQNVAFASRSGDIGMQITGRLIAYPGAAGGTGAADSGAGFRVGWDGSGEWAGFVPFEDNPRVLNPRDGLVISANNPTLPAPMPYYISAYWEPVDRAARIHELLLAKEKLSPQDMQAIQGDVVWVTARKLVPRLMAAHRAATPAPRTAEALGLLGAWDSAMDADQAAPTIFAAFYEHLFRLTLEPRLGEGLVTRLREKDNVWVIMLQSVLNGDLAYWLNRPGESQDSLRDDLLRRSLAAALDDLHERLDGEPASWQWGKLHTLTLTHPLGRVAALAPLFNVGPLPIGGHGLTVNKAQFNGGSYAVSSGPSMRQVTDLAAGGKAVGVIPSGQSGIAASPHYADLAPLWWKGSTVPLSLNRAEIDAAAEGTLLLSPAQSP